MLFSLKNYKKFYNFFGHEEYEKLLDNVERVITNRLSDGDFSVRYDRHKILMILPGKNRQYATPLANSIRSEVIHNFSRKDMQLLLTFLTAQFPDDGDDLFTLIESVE